MAVAVVVHDLLVWWSEGSFPFSTLAGLWSHIDPGSLGTAQTSVRRHVSGALWSWTVRPVLMLPALPAFLVLGVVCLWFGGRDGGRTDNGNFLGARPPRRRRSRGLS